MSSYVFILSDISSFTFEMDCVCIHCVSETVMIQVFNLATLNHMDMDWGQNVCMMLLLLNMMDAWKCAKNVLNINASMLCWNQRCGVRYSAAALTIGRLVWCRWGEPAPKTALPPPITLPALSLRLLELWKCRETTCLIGTKKMTPSPHSWDTDDQCVCLVWHRTSSNMPYHKLHMGHKSTASHWSDSHTQRPWYILE